VTQTELAEWYDVQRRTIYSWLKRLDTDESLEQAVSDAKRTGRKRKLSESQQENSKRLFTTHLKKSGLTRRRGRRRSSKNFSTKHTALRTRSRVVGGY
jgi:transposase